ncbi:RluA family pseudouridine synthase [Halobacillus salinarum]|uniref:Pseudouridine synthase n=1 Tax=Halobacillus salinarum TaxID=2932257 RepID=A0ABY4EG19_9BACI|nr:RluA family pseudouridine synthase [Halobacillus salinarum]UOQ43419.1 RluA family pseudouridine synthase [Halobacillus salinarum]
MNKHQKHWTIDFGADGHSIREYVLNKQLFSRQLLRKVKEYGRFEINGRKAFVYEKLKKGDRLLVQFPLEKRSERLIPQPVPLDMIYEDEDVLVLNKPQGMGVSPNPQQQMGTVANGLAYHYEVQNIPSTVHIVTRLDKDTSGLMLVAKHQYSHDLLANHTEIRRYYLALVHGCLKKGKGSIEVPIARAEGSIIKRCIDSSGKPAATVYEAKKCFDDISLVELKLLTGRTHQIRVHLSHIGYPLIGDTLYGGEHREWTNGQALHCHRLIFIHPYTKKKMNFCLPFPESWEKSSRLT